MTSDPQSHVTPVTEGRSPNPFPNRDASKICRNLWATQGRVIPPFQG
ncbi:hypothetical protein J0895_10355 [Phormidium pseudopriestleyi FRX01]|uniref:Uncharacterized protein n=1 Tax=Phormidium pseudopriestleyi FRX01 TaxID=1759528 RepID=A0ABS3FRM0_9CYAN|nr:hypothetical protein [Phormidium pseudopriestleyi]MBO0349502.1 hypothetical protein [Phormidium pseudopriestleyi FRX01]